MATCTKVGADGLRRLASGSPPPKTSRRPPTASRAFPTIALPKAGNRPRTALRGCTGAPTRMTGQVAPLKSSHPNVTPKSLPESRLGSDATVAPIAPAPVWTDSPGPPVPSGVNGLTRLKNRRPPLRSAVKPSAQGLKQLLPFGNVGAFRPHPLTPRLLDMAPTAEGLKIGFVIGVDLRMSERSDVVHFKPSRPSALDAAPPVPVKHPAPHPRPPAPVDSVPSPSHRQSLRQGCCRRW